MKEEKDRSAKLWREFSDLNDTVKHMTAEAASQAAAARQLGESAKLLNAQGSGSIRTGAHLFYEQSSSYQQFCRV
jgi:hypothetical protein